MAAFLALLVSATIWLWSAQPMERTQNLAAAALPPPPLQQAPLQQIRGGEPQHLGAPAQSPVKEPPSSKARRLCQRVLPSASCIRNTNLDFDQQQLLLMALSRSDAKLCPGERLVLTGLPGAPRLRVTPKSLSRRARSGLRRELRNLRGHPTMPFQVEIRCPSR
jgi:hypothetical protein